MNVNIQCHGVIIAFCISIIEILKKAIMKFNTAVGSEVELGHQRHVPDPHTSYLPSSTTGSSSKRQSVWTIPAPIFNFGLSDDLPWAADPDPEEGADPSCLGPPSDCCPLRSDDYLFH